MARLMHVGRQPGDPAYALQGYEALDRAGATLGTIASVVADGETWEVRYVVIDSGGWFASKQFVAPVGDIEQVNADERFVVFERLTKELLGSDSYPRYDEGWWQQQDQDQFAAHEHEVARAYEPGRSADEAIDYRGALYRSRPWRGEASLQLVEERLVPRTESYLAGGVRVSKQVVTRTETVTVPLQEERILIERLPGDGHVFLGERELQDGETVELITRQERVVVTKEQVVHEEVRVRTEQLQRTEQVSDTVRREELVVDDAGGNASERRGGVPDDVYHLPGAASVGEAAAPPSEGSPPSPLSRPGRAGANDTDTGLT